MINQNDVSGKSYTDLMSLISEDPEFEVLNYFKNLIKSGYKWKEAYANRLLINQCWSAPLVRDDLERSFDLFINSFDNFTDDEKIKIKNFSRAIGRLFYSHWHNFLLVQMRETLYELYLVALYEIGEMEKEEAVEKLSKIGLKEEYIEDLLNGGIRFYSSEESYNKWNISGGNHTSGVKSKRTITGASRSEFICRDFVLLENSDEEDNDDDYGYDSYGIRIEPYVPMT